MLNQTREALKNFDNQHDFERLAADLLNALGFSGVDPIAPAGGGDGGLDIKFQDGAQLGVGFVTLEKKIRDKFKRDLAKLAEGQGKLALFCIVDVTPSTKSEFARDALSKGYMLEVYDLERLRSLLDSRFQDLRSRYLHLPSDVRADVIVEYWSGSHRDPNGAGLVVHNIGDDVALYLEGQRLTPTMTFDRGRSLKSLRPGERKGILDWESGECPIDAPAAVPTEKYMTRVVWLDRSGERHLSDWSLTDKR